MSTNHTEIAILLDRSGSMMPYVADHVGGIKSFVEDQKNAPGEARFTLVQFDSTNPFELIYDGVPMEKVDHIELIPRGGTPLLDAVGMTLAHIEKRLSDHTGPVIIMIVTDGEENQSREWTREKVKSKIAEAEKKNWRVLYLGANVDAFSEASMMGMGSGSTASYNATHVGTQTVYATMSRKTSGARHLAATGAPILDTMNSLDFTPEDREQLAKAGEEQSIFNSGNIIPNKEKK